ncbi:MAG: extracellular solute-binding protein [Cetobacterium sp.]
MKKLILLGAMSLLVMSCGEKESKNKEITIWTQASAEHPEGKMFQARVEEYNKNFPNKLPIKIQNFTRAGAGSGYMDKLNAAITASDAPDIFTLDGPDIASYATAGVIRQLDNVMNEDFLSGFTEAIKEQGTIDNKLYGIGYQDSGVIILYNEEIIEMLPKDVKSLIPMTPEADWTWDDFYKISSAVKDLKNSEFKETEAIKKLELPVSFSLGDIVKGGYEIAMYYLAPIIWANNSNVVSEDGLTTDGYLNNPKTIEALQVFGKFFRDDLGGIVESEKAFHNGKAALAVAGSWYISDLTNNYPKLKYRALKYPKISKEFIGNYTPSGSWAFVMNGALKNDDFKTKEVLEALEWMTNDDSVKVYYDANKSIPVRTAMIDIVDTNTPNQNFNEAWTALKNEVKNTNKARPNSPIYPYISETFAKDIISKIAREKTTDFEMIKKYTDEAIMKIDREAKKYRK